MKNMIYAVGLLAFLGTFTTSCEKESLADASTSSRQDLNIIDQQLYPKISVIDNVLSFESIDYFTTLVSNDSEEYAVEELSRYLQSTAFDSYGKKYGADSEYDEVFIDAIMNEQKIVKIGKWYLYIDIPTELVLAISEDERTPVQALLERSNKTIKEFSIGDDVLVHLAEGTLPNARACGGVGGGVYACYPGVWTGQIIKTFPSGKVWRLNPYARFFRAGVYFKLSSQYQVWTFISSSYPYGSLLSDISGEGLSIEMFIRYPKAWWKKRPCNASSVGTRSGGSHFTNGTDGKDDRAVYSGSRNLNGYYFYVQGRANYSDGTSTGASPYGGRNINSPY